MLQAREHQVLDEVVLARRRQRFVSATRTEDERASQRRRTLGPHRRDAVDLCPAKRPHDAKVSMLQT
jgi:hypothetical protein